jgi:hypothetical protein
MLTRLSQDPAPFLPVSLAPEPAWRGEKVAAPIARVADLDEQMIDYIESMADRLLASQIATKFLINVIATRVRLDRLAADNKIFRQCRGGKNRGTLYWAIGGVN